MQTHILLLGLLITISSTAATRGELPPEPLGGYTPIQNTSDPHVVEVAKFAVKQHNKQDPAHRLRLLRVVKGYSQVVAGINWKLNLNAKQYHTHGHQTYLAVLYERPWEHYLNLTSFKLLHY